MFVSSRGKEKAKHHCFSVGIQCLRNAESNQDDDDRSRRTSIICVAKCKCVVSGYGTISIQRFNHVTLQSGSSSGPRDAENWRSLDCRVQSAALYEPMYVVIT